MVILNRFYLKIGFLWEKCEKRVLKPFTLLLESVKIGLVFKLRKE